MYIQHAVLVVTVLTGGRSSETLLIVHSTKLQPPQLLVFCMHCVFSLLPSLCIHRSKRSRSRSQDRDDDRGAKRSHHDSSHQSRERHRSRGHTSPEPAVAKPAVPGAREPSAAPLAAPPPRIASQPKGLTVVKAKQFDGCYSQIVDKLLDIQPKQVRLQQTSPC